MGSITPGKRADLTLIDARKLGMSPVIDPVASVVQSATPADVDTVMVEGRVLKSGGRLLAVNEDALKREIAVGRALLNV
ncbi:amidohydrolase family protein [Pseudomonas syringae]|nr:amidohydrolase family protein [Pseudomonas syringae]